MIDGLWYGTPVRIIHDDGYWVTVKFMRKCSHFDNGQQVTMSSYGIIRRTPIFKRMPVVAVIRCSA